MLFDRSEWERIKWVFFPWPKEFLWKEFPLHYQAGFDNCDGDWVLGMAIDQIFHEEQAVNVLDVLSRSNSALVTFQKFSFVLWDKYYSKADYALAMNKKKYKQLGFGKTEVDNDWVYPIFVKGKDEDGVGYGVTVPSSLVVRSGIPFYNYDAVFRTKEMQAEHFWRLSKARHKWKGDVS